MPDDFQAEPPDLPPAAAGLTPSGDDQYGEASFRKPDTEQSELRGVKLAALLVAIGLLTFVGYVLWTATSRRGATLGPTPSSTRAPKASSLPNPVLQAIEEEAARELRRLNGTWGATAVIIDGKKATAEEVAKVKLTLDAEDSYSLVLPTAKHVGSYVILPTTTPKGIEFHSADTSHKDVNLAIYDIDGDALTICMNPFTNNKKVLPQPGDFTAPAGTQRILLELKRQQKER